MLLGTFIRTRFLLANWTCISTMGLWPGAERMLA